METTIINNFSEIYKFSDLKYNNPEKCANGSFSKVYKNNNENILIETPFLKVKSNKIDSFSNKSYYYLKLYLMNMNDDKDFFQFLYDLEDFNLLVVKKNCMDWFNQKIPDNILYKNQKRPWNIDRDGNIILNIKVKRNINGLNHFKNIKKGDFISLRILFDGINFGKKKFGSNLIADSYKAEDFEYNIFNTDGYDNYDTEVQFSFQNKKTLENQNELLKNHDNETNDKINIGISNENDLDSENISNHENDLDSENIPNHENNLVNENIPNHEGDLDNEIIPNHEGDLDNENIPNQEGDLDNENIPNQEGDLNNDINPTIEKSQENKNNEINFNNEIEELKTVVEEVIDQSKNKDNLTIKDNKILEEENKKSENSLEVLKLKENPKKNKNKRKNIRKKKKIIYANRIRVIK